MPKRCSNGAEFQTDLNKVQTDLNKAHVQVEDAETQNPIEKNETRKFHERWCKVWSWLYYKDEKMYCDECVKNGKKNSFITGCCTFKTSSMVRHSETEDHKNATHFHFSDIKMAHLQPKWPIPLNDHGAIVP